MYTAGMYGTGEEEGRALLRVVICCSHPLVVLASTASGFPTFSRVRNDPHALARVLTSSGAPSGINGEDAGRAGGGQGHYRAEEDNQDVRRLFGRRFVESLVGVGRFLRALCQD